MNHRTRALVKLIVGACLAFIGLGMVVLGFIFLTFQPPLYDWVAVCCGGGVILITIGGLLVFAGIADR